MSDMPHHRFPFVTRATVALLTTMALATPYGYAAEEEYLKPYHLLDVMHRFQRYADKLYFSGKSENWELAGWYLWKLESAARPVIEGQTVPYRTENYDARPLMESMLLPAIERLESEIDAERADGFQSAYGSLVETCNACHQATEHGFVEIITPRQPTYGNQSYAP